MAQPDLSMLASARETPHGVYSGVDRPPGDRHPGTGWHVFAGSMILLASVTNFVWGIAALSDDRHLRRAELLFGSLSTWGAIFVAFAALQMITAVLVFARSRIGSALGIAMAVCSACVQLLAVGAYPIWSVTVIVVDGLVIYGLAVHGGHD